MLISNTDFVEFYGLTLGHRKTYCSMPGNLFDQNILYFQSFTSIVGPNGSGKSNVIDSMLFVFGYRASKVRLKKISGLIHNSENHLNINSCTVSVFFQKIIDTGVSMI